MMNQLSRYIAPALLAGALMAGPLPAAAQDTDAVVDRLQELMAELGTNVAWEATEADGDDIILTGVTVSEGGETLALGDIRLSGISEIVDGYRIEEMSMENYVFGDDDGSFEIDGVLLSGVILPDEGTGEAYGGMFFYERAEVAEMRATVAGEEVFLLTNLNATVTPAGNGEPMRFSGGAEHFEADLSGVEDDVSGDVIQRMGYEQITGRLDMDGSWEPSDGRIAFTQFDLTIDQGGTLGFTFDISGYTPDFVRALGELSPDANDSASAMAMMGLMQQLSLYGAEISFRDDSLTERVLAIFAEDQGMRPQDVVNQAKAFLPFMLAQMNAPQLGTMVADAVSEFLDNPQSIRITASPEQPVPFALLMAGAMGSPQAMADQIGLEVVAND
jgi:hypothetical protein